MATSLTITSSYNGESAGKFISAAILSAPTLDSDAVTIMPNVKHKMTIQKFATDGIIKNATCDFDPTSSITLTEKTLQPEFFQVNQQFCKTPFRSTWDALEMGYSASDVIPKSFSDFLIAQQSALVAAGMEVSFWRGVNATAGEFDGIMTQLAVDATLPPAQEIAGTTVDAANVIAELHKIIEACPDAVYGKEDLTLYVSNNIYRQYVSALGGFAAAGVGANGYDNKGTNQIFGDVFFEGVKVFMANGLAANTALLAQKSNLYFATGLLSDMQEVSLIDMSPIDGSQNARFVMRFSADAKYGWAEDLVSYGITNAAN